MIELDKKITKLLYPDENLVFDEENRIFANSEEELREALKSGFVGNNCYRIEEPISFSDMIPNYSTDIKIAMRLIRVMRKGSLSVRIEILPDTYYVSYTKIVNNKSYSWLSYDKNLPVAICKSFIQWKEDE